jgi:hypothetical protein
MQPNHRIPKKTVSEIQNRRTFIYTSLARIVLLGVATTVVRFHFLLELGTNPEDDASQERQYQEKHLRLVLAEVNRTPRRRNVHAAS